ncbi:MAG: class I SAM-dependent methyltransferase [Ignavibacteria bacterium]
MSNKESHLFLEKLLAAIRDIDALHSKKLKKNLNIITQNHEPEFLDLLELIYYYFLTGNFSPERIATDYLKMVNDMRKQGLYFHKNDEYSCKNQADAYNNVYSNNEIMSYYMNALLISQILWKHHFNMFMYFKDNLNNYFNSRSRINILDVGPGHGFFSHMIQKSVTGHKRIDIVDISESSLNFTKKILGFDKNVNYFEVDIIKYETENKYDLIVLGEIIEHLDNPSEMLNKLSELLTEDGVLWLTTPTNAPALDHVYLFRTKDDVFNIINKSKLKVVDYYSEYSEDVNEEIAMKYKVTCLIGAFCKKY